MNCTLLHTLSWVTSLCINFNRRRTNGKDTFCVRFKSLHRFSPIKQIFLHLNMGIAVNMNRDDNTVMALRLFYVRTSQ